MHPFLNSGKAMVPSHMHGFVQNLGRTTLNFLKTLGRITLFQYHGDPLDIYATLLLDNNYSAKSLILDIIPCQLLD